MTQTRRTKREEARRLWQLSFGDTDEFLDRYFDRLYREEDVLLAEEGSKAIGHLQFPELSLSLGEATLPAGYVVAVCTHPDHRGKGIMRPLLQEALRREKARGDVVSVLLPAEDWLYRYYTLVGGYAPVVNRARSNRQEDALREEDPAVTASSLVDYLLEVEASQQEPSLLHSGAFWEVITEDFEQEEDLALQIHRTELGLIDGALFLVKGESELLVQALYGTKPVREALLTEVTGESKLPQSYLLRPSEGGIPEARAMMRVLDAPRFLEALARYYPELTLSFTYRDELFPENDGDYLISSGEVERLPRAGEGESAPKKCLSPAELIAALSDALGRPIACSMRLLFEDPY
nr:GNAT family N-acetyltransferase [uncultured Porphyromonas sp.]